MGLFCLESRPKLIILTKTVTDRKLKGNLRMMKKPVIPAKAGTHQPIISAIVAMAENRVIGKNNQLPWRLPADLKHFKSLTTGKPILMGRKTYESIGKALPHRTNIVITHDPAFHAPQCVVVPSIESALQQAALQNPQEIFIIGGASIYQQSI